MALKMAVFGDSVTWGQGLLPEHKFSNLVYSSLNGSTPAAGDLTVLAHSGATIGINSTKIKLPLDGEVPDSYPTITQQCDAFTGRPEAIDVVIVNGGINDVGAVCIVNPLSDADDLEEMTVQYCRKDMVTLLGKVVATFPNPSTKIVVPSYFPILSEQSSLELVPHFLDLHGVRLGDLLGAFEQEIFEKIFGQCRTFFERSSTCLNEAVTEANAKDGKGRLRFAQVPFQPSNAALAPEAWLWGVTSTLSPEDEVIVSRRAACSRDEPDLLQREQCYRASAGHPNKTGAARFAASILAALK